MFYYTIYHYLELLIHVPWFFTFPPGRCRDLGGTRDLRNALRTQGVWNDSPGVSPVANFKNFWIFYGCSIDSLLIF